MTDVLATYEHNTDISSAFKWVQMELLANCVLFPHPAVTEKHVHSPRVVFLSTWWNSDIHSLLVLFVGPYQLPREISGSLAAKRSTVHQVVPNFVNRTFSAGKVEHSRLLLWPKMTQWQ